MAVSREDVIYIAKLAKLELKENEIDDYTIQMNRILVYMDKLNELDTEKVEPLSHPVPAVNIFREDTVKGSVSREDALKNAPESTEEFFIVPKIITVE